jgi:hypothetical protein
MKNVLQFLGNIVLTAVIGFTLVACPTDPTGGKPQPDKKGELKAVIVDISKDSEWDCLVVGKDGSSMVFNVDETTNMPTRLYLKPRKDSDAGFTYTFKENGLVDKVAANGYMVLFENFAGYTFDLAVIAPDGTIEYHYGIETDIDFEAYLAPSIAERSMAGRSISDWVRNLNYWDILDHMMGISTCVAGIFVTPMLIGCGTYVLSTAAELAVAHAFDEYELASDIAGLSIDGANLVLDGIGCASVAAGNIVTGMYDCIALYASLCSKMAGEDDKIFTSLFPETEQVKEEMKPVMGKVKVNFYANGGSGTGPAAQTIVTTDGVGSVQLPATVGFYRSGYTFICWSTSPGGSVLSYDAGGTYTITRNTSFYAQWDNLLQSVPTGVTATAVSSDSITVSWNPVSGAIGYYVYRAQSYNDYHRVGTVYTPSTSYTDTGLSGNTQYDYKVSYFNSMGESDSVHAWAKTPAGGGGGVVTYQIGETGPGGGKIFYYSEEGFAVQMVNSAQNYIAHYLEVSPADVGTLAWASSAFIPSDFGGTGSWLNIEGTTATAIGTGRKNTALILATDADAPAAKACNDYTGGGQTDWFLPSENELIQLYVNRSAVGIAGGSVAYWSSTQREDYYYGRNGARSCAFLSGNMGNSNKNEKKPVRAVRAF